jgi:hypothetical protein
MRSAPHHVHFLSDAGLGHVARDIESHAARGAIQVWRQHLAAARGVRALGALNRALRTAGAPVRKPFVVAGTRDPAALYLSLVFEDWWRYAPRYEDVTPELARALILDAKWRAPWVNWFDDELRAVFGLDALAEPFDRARGWQVYENGDARAVVFRQENMGALPDALGALYGLPADSFVLGSENAAESKAYAAHYSAVRAAVRFTDAELDELYAPRFVGHFYAPAEIAALKARWRVGAAEPPRVRRKAAPVCAKPTEPPAEPHIAVCRPCWKCKADLVRLPHYEHRCAVQTARLDQLEAALAARPAAPGPVRPLWERAVRGVARRLRALVRPG